MSSSEIVLGGARNWRTALPTVFFSTAAVWAALGGGQWWLFALMAALNAPFIVAAPSVILRDDTIEVRMRKNDRTFRWDDVLEASWTGGSFQYAGPVLRTRGSAWDTPSPGVPAQVAMLVVPGRGAARTFEDECRRHGVPYTPDLLKLVNTGKRPARLPSDGERQKRLED